MCRPVKPKRPARTNHEKVTRFSTFVVGGRPTDPKTDSNSEIVAASTLTKAKISHKQVPSRDNPGPSALAQKHHEVMPRVGRYLGGGDPPPPETLFYKGMQRKPKTDLQSIHRDAHAGRVRTTTRTSLQSDGSLQYLIFGTLVRSLERVFSGERGNDMTDVDLVATSPCPRTAGPLTWPTRRVGAGLTQAWKGQSSYDRPDKGNGGKVDIPQLQEGRRMPRRKDHEQRGEVQYCGKQ
ncbi:hypothetical protein B296_00024708 [Ensete ventricosum]|uniref:Uncharacterized protein n=1 Tax=Ensete ventricosum TaxID=4639 RepID=A0A426XR58_ENSVE|nr:hypothetical protein B296_00024708 [Ensete ventricosum]